MKAIVVFLVLLAAAKIGYHEYMFRIATNEIIVAAYRERAITACQRDTKAQTPTDGANWSRPQSVRLVIGKSNVDVQIWQVDHTLWNARFKNPYLFLAGNERGSRLYCEFDIVNGAASIFRM